MPSIQDIGSINIGNTISAKCLKKKFSPEEDRMLKALVEQYGTHSWKLIAELIKTRNCRQCRERWRNYLSQNISLEPWSPHEDQLLRQKYSEYGPQWTKIQSFFTNRTDVNLKNRWAVLQRKGHHALAPAAPAIAPAPAIPLPTTAAVVAPPPVVAAVAAPLPAPPENLPSPSDQKFFDLSYFDESDDMSLDIFLDPFDGNDSFDDFVPIL